MDLSMRPFGRIDIFQEESNASKKEQSKNWQIGRIIVSAWSRPIGGGKLYKIPMCRARNRSQAQADRGTAGVRMK